MCDICQAVAGKALTCSTSIPTSNHTAGLDMYFRTVTGCDSSGIYEIIKQALLNAHISELGYSVTNNGLPNGDQLSSFFHDKIINACCI
jgi:hypothetical protein